MKGRCASASGNILYVPLVHSVVRSRLVVRPPATSALYLKLWTCKKTVLAAPAPSRLAARVSSPLPSEPMCTPVPFHLNETQYTCKFIGTSRTQAVGRGGVWWPRGVRDRAGGEPPGPPGRDRVGEGAGGRGSGWRRLHEVKKPELSVFIACGQGISTTHESVLQYPD